MQKIRTATFEDLDAIAAVEAACFPAAEAATAEEFAGRLAHYAGHFWLLLEQGELVAFVDGFCTDMPDLTDEMYTDAALHDENGAWQMIFGVNTLPRCRCRVQGAAVATVIAQGISVVLCILYVMRRVPLLLPARKHWAVGQHLYWELFSQSISMGLMSSIVSAGSVVLQYGINGLGTLTIAGHTAARKLFSFTSMPLISMANAGSTFVSQNRGAAQPERVRKGMRTMYLCSVVIMAAEVVLMQLFARQLVQLISGSSAPLVLENGARYLMWNAPFYAVLGVLLCTRYALQSLGQKVLPLFSSVIELVGKVIFVLVFIPRYAYNAVILCEPIIWCFMAAYLVLVYLHDPFVFPKKSE